MAKWSAKSEGELSTSLSLLPYGLLAILFLLISIHPRNVETGADNGRRFLSEDVGYKAAIDSLAALGVFNVKRLPAVEGLPSRNAVVFDDQALERRDMRSSLCPKHDHSTLSQIKGALLSRFGAPQGRTDGCVELLADYRRATFLNQDMIRASEDIWIKNGRSIGGILRQSHSVRESGYDPSSSEFKIFYAGSNFGRSVPFTLVDPASLSTNNISFDGSGNKCTSAVLPKDFSIYCFDRGIVMTGVGRVGETVTVNGRRPDRSTENPSQIVIPLQAGDTIAFADSSGGNLKAFQLLSKRQAISGIFAGERLRDPAFSELTSQIDMGLATNISSSIDPTLQKIVQEKLDQVLEGAPRRAGASFRGSIMLMDGLNGSIAASATFPNKPSHLLPKDRTRPERQIWLEQNQGFAALPVGSTAKVPFAFAIGTAHPELLRLKIANSQTIQYDPRLFLETGSFEQSRRKGRGSIQLQGSNSVDVTFSMAIAVSDNPYAVKLVREAWVASDASPGEADWLHNVHTLTCATPVKAAEKRGCPVYLWGDQFRPTRGPPHKSVQFEFAPEKVADAPHNELFYGPLGNGSYNWSLAQLTQSYARLVSGEMVAASLTSQPTKKSPLAGQMRGEGYASAWQATIRGMRNVITTGTAKQLSSFDIGQGAELIGKTGTPTVRYRRGSNGKVLVLAAVKTESGRPLKVLGDQASICSLRFISINLQYDTSPLPIVTDLIADNPALREWMTGGC